MKRVAACAFLLSLVAGSAAAATTTGRITYMAQDRHQLMLDNSDMYTLGPRIDRSAVEIGDRVRIDWQKQGGEDVITGMVKAPLTATTSG